MSTDEKVSDIEKSSQVNSVVQQSWTEEEERKLVWKLDWRLLPVVTVLYLANFIDRTNVGNAKVAGLEKDLGLKGVQYNLGLSIFYILYSFSEVPSNLILKKVGADRWIPSLVLGFGLVCTCTSVIKDFSGFMGVRAMLGLMEGGMMPGVAYYLSTYYKRHELVFRICIFVSASSTSGAFGGLLASGLLKIKQLDFLPHGQWRNIFFVEGLITIFLALCGYFLLPGPKERTNFLNEREREIAVGRLSLEAVVEDKNVLHAGWGRAFLSVNTWVCAICFLLNNMSVQGISLFMPSLLKGMGYSTIKSQLYTVPVYITASVWSVGLAYSSFKIGRRGIPLLITTPIAIIGLAILLGSADHHANYGAIFLVAIGVFPQGPLFLTWATNNAEPSTVRAVTSAFVVSVGSLGPIVSSWIYLAWDAPRYHIANAVQLGAQCGILCLITFLIWHNVKENSKRQAGGRNYRLDKPEHVVKQLGDKHPEFRLTI
ncbi:major facilitator superfamily domain-containing protein [Flagelloscypha sp. PMI_526]|nr:major facilitator superfamily domain-containing protein [Flagelloscypha sp. PMI_526]